MEDLTDVTARQILDALVARDPAYQWHEMDHVAVIRPVAAWNDPADPLNLFADRFVITNGRVFDSICVVLRQPSNARESMIRAGPLMNRRLSTSFSGGTILEGLNAVMRAHQRRLVAGQCARFRIAAVARAPRVRRSWS